ncbi:MAG: WhiB family transcriptional regulator [Acidimicrobiales bacterium]|nr:WhiB family transcriptional regulator [Acidimicrobiales bacterium]
MTAWQHAAACKGIPTRDFFARQPGARAVAACQRCTVAAECLADEARLVTSVDDVHGYRAGMSEAQRRLTFVNLTKRVAGDQDRLERAERARRERRAGVTMSVIAENEGVHRRTVMRWLADDARAAG